MATQPFCSKFTVPFQSTRPSSVIETIWPCSRKTKPFQNPWPHETYQFVDGLPSFLPLQRLIRCTSCTLRCQTVPQPEQCFRLLKQKQKNQDWSSNFLIFVSVLQRRAAPPTQIGRNLVGAVRKHPEEDPVCAAHQLASFIHPHGYEHATGLHRLHEDVARDRHVLPATQWGWATLEKNYHDSLWYLAD